MAAPTAGVAAKDELVGEGAGASAARAPAAEAATTRTAQAIFLISIAGGEKERLILISWQLLLLLLGVVHMPEEGFIGCGNGWDGWAVGEAGRRFCGLPVV